MSLMPSALWKTSLPKEKRSTVAVRLPIGSVLSVSLPSSFGLISTCFKVKIKLDNELASQVKSWYNNYSFGGEQVC